MSKKVKPATGRELLRRLAAYEAQKVKEGACSPGELLAHVQAEGNRAGLSGHMIDWPCPEPAYGIARAAAEAFFTSRGPASAPQLEHLGRLLAARGKRWAEVAALVGADPSEDARITVAQARRAVTLLGGVNPPGEVTCSS